MIKAPRPDFQTEQKRLATLDSYKVLDTDPEQALDKITKSAAALAECPVALISLVADERQWFKSKHGVDVCETDRDISFCGHAIHSSRPLIVNDAFLDERFVDNPLVTDGPMIRFYCGFPLVAEDGSIIGTLCVIDTSPRTLPATTMEILELLAQQIIGHLELSRKSREFNKLIKNTKVYHEAIESLSLICRLNTEGKITYVNEMFYQKSGHNRQELLGSDLELIQSDSNSKSFVDEVWRRVRSGNLWRGEIRNRAKDGSIYWLDTVIHPVFGEDDQIEEFIAIQYDISPYKQSELLYTETQRIAKIGGWELNIQDMTTQWTPETYRIHGIEAHDRLPAEDAIQFYAEHERERIRILLDNCIRKGEPYSSDFEFINAKNEKLWVHSKGIPEFDNNGRVIRLLGTFQDVTEAKNMQQQLLESKSRLEIALDAAELGTWEWNLRTQEVTVDTRWKSMIGLGDNQSSFQVQDWLDRVHPEDYAVCKKRLNDYIEGKTDRFAEVYRLRHNAGHYVYIAARGRFTAWDEHARPIRFTGTDFDMTKQVLAEQDSLKQRARANHNAKLASIGQLAAGVAHEVNNPLAIIKGYCASLSRHLQKLGLLEDANLSSPLNKIDVATDRIANIVKGLRSFARSDTERKDSFKVVAAIQESIDLLAQIYRQDGVQLKFIKNTNTPELVIHGNRGKFQQILMNLLANAKDAIVDNNDKLIVLGYELTNKRFEFYVKDNGVGIEPSIQDNIFDPFFTTKDIDKGTGLGLSLVYNFVEELQGEVRVESKKDRGTRFVVSLPVQQLTKPETPDKTGAA